MPRRWHSTVVPVSINVRGQTSSPGFFSRISAQLRERETASTPQRLTLQNVHPSAAGPAAPEGFVGMSRSEAAPCGEEGTGAPQPSPEHLLRRVSALLALPRPADEIAGDLGRGALGRSVSVNIPAEEQTAVLLHMRKALLERIQDEVRR